MLLTAFPSGPFATNAYLLQCKQTGQAAIFDPAPGSAQDLKWATAQLYIKKILLTHSHWDHIGDLAELKKYWDVPVYVHELDAANVFNPGSDGLPMMMPIEGVQVDGFLEDGQQIQVGALLIQVIHTPGHTPGGVCFYLKEQGILLSGDTLFKGSIGNLSFSTANPDAMWTSLKKLAKLPSDTKVYPGHGEPTMIGKETWLENAKEVFTC
ncbi:MAG: MBL fold metallo-hydrolase [Chlamydiales bacterium]|nr:MBL fold metallo-hydrolase [Chlamydiales bacterium]